MDENTNMTAGVSYMYSFCEHNILLLFNSDAIINNYAKRFHVIEDDLNESLEWRWMDWKEIKI